MPKILQRGLWLFILLTDVAGAQTLTPSTLTFPNTGIGVTSAALTATLTNTGTTALTISAKAISGTNAADFAISTTGTTCGATLAASASCDIAVTFDPGASGTRTATLKVTDNGATTSQQINLTGTGVAVPTDTLSANSIAFGNGTVGAASAAQSVTVTNSGTGPLAITSIALAGANPGDFATTNTCGTSLAANSSCAISATFTATTTGARSATITLTDNAADSPRVITLSGTGVAAAVPGVSLNPPALTFASTNVGATAAAQTVTVTNSGSAPLTVTAATITGANSSDFAVSANTCTTSIAANGTCSISVTFTPTATGARAAALTITDNAGGTAGAQQSVPLSGTGAGVAAVTLSPQTLSFGSSNVGVASTAQSVMLTNSGSGTLSISSVTIGGTNAGDFAIGSNTCGVTLATGASCSVSVTFDPTAAGSRAASLVFADSAGNSPQSASLTGTGVGVAAANLSPNALSFGNGNIGTTSAAQSVTLSNPGSAALTISSIAITGANAADFATTNTCGGSVAAAGSCSISVTFDATATGTRSATLTVTDNATGSPQQVTLSGTGVGVPTATLSAASISFSTANIGTTSTSQSITVTNSGTGALSIASIVLGGTNSGDFSTTNTCGTSLAAGSNCAISATFHPSAAGSRAATIALTDNAADSPQTISLTGTGVGVPAASLSAASLSFGNTNINTTATAQSVTLSNSGTGALTISIINIAGSNSADFATSNTCNGSVAAGGNCTISVTFTPTAAGSRSATLTVADNATGSPQSVTLSGTGVAVPQASLSPTSLSFGNSNTGATTAAQTISLTNSGSGALSISSITLAGTNPGDFAIAGNNCGSSLAAGQSCTITITFTPTAINGRSASLVVADNASNQSGSQQTASLSGTGIALPIASVSPMSVGFGTSTTPQTVTLSNTGTGTLAIASVAIGGANASNFGIFANSCGSSLTAGSSCTISISFTPPSSSSSSSATLTITDNSNNTPGSTQSVALSGLTPLTITTQSLNSGTAGTAYSASVVPQGGTSPYTWSVSAGSLPAGLSLNTSNGFISGTPASAASSTFTIKVNDSGSPVQSATHQYTITIAAPTLTINSAELSFGTVGAAYAAYVQPLGGTAPYTWSVASGTLPPGTSLAGSTGFLTGTPTTAGTFTFTARVTDSSSPVQTATQQFGLVINPATLKISTTSLPNGTTAVAYSNAIVATGGTTPYTWSLSSGTLPAGLSLNTASGAITGTPTASGTSTFTVKVADSGSPAQTTSQMFTVSISTGLTITTTSLASGTAGLFYTATLLAQSGTAPYTWSMTGLLPSGLTLNASTGTLSGTPTATGTFSFIVKVTDASSPAQSATQALSLFINPPTTEPITPTFSFTNVSGTVTPGANITSATVQLSQASSAEYTGTLSLALTPNSSLTGLPAGYLGDAGFVSSTGTKSATSTVTIPASATSVAFPTFDPGTVAGNIGVTLTVGSQTAASSSVTIAPAAPIIEAGSVQITDVTSSGFNVELVATSTTRDLQTATFTFNAATGAQLNGTNFTVNVSSLLSNWFASSSGLTYGGAFSLTIPFTLSGSSSAIASVTVTLTNSVGTSAAATGVQ
jgi:two-component sensor histidine kinase